MMNEMIELDLRDILRVLVKRVWIIALCAVIAGTAALVYTVNFVAPQYTASICMYVNNNSGKDSDYISSNDLSVATKLVATYVNIIRSDAVLEKVVDDAGLMLSASQIRGMVEATAVGKTEMFEVSVTSTNPQMSADIANTIAKIAPDHISSIIEGSTEKIIDYAKVPAQPSGPDYTQNAIMGFSCGLLLAILVIVIIHLADTRVKSDHELKNICRIPVLGRIPNLDTENNKPSKGLKR